MKKLMITIISLVFSMNLGAQNDGFFTTNYSEYREETNNEWGIMPKFPDQHGGLDDYSAVPLGSGLLLLGGMALVYGMRKRE